MAELSTRDIKIVQYLNEALTKERQLEQALQAHIAMTTLAPYKKRLQQHLSETKNHARGVERRIKQLGGESDGISGVVQDAAGRVQEVAARGAALAQGPIHMVRGTSEQEVLLKNARTEFKEEAEEIGTYTMIQNLAESVGDRTTADLAKAILREEKRMAGFLEKLIPRLTKSVAQAEIPARERAVVVLRRDVVLREAVRRRPPLRSPRGISAWTTDFVRRGISFSRKPAMRFSSRRIAFASRAVSLSPTDSASFWIAV